MERALCVKAIFSSSLLSPADVSVTTDFVLGFCDKALLFFYGTKAGEERKGNILLQNKNISMDVSIGGFT